VCHLIIGDESSKHYVWVGGRAGVGVGVGVGVGAGLSFKKYKYYLAKMQITIG